jgi:hypothetical protein
MNRLTILGTAALVASALAVPAAATTSSDTGKHMRHHTHYRTARPVAGAAVGTAGAIATAPFGTFGTADAYGPGYYNYYGAGWNGGRWDQGYASRNGIACTPGTWIKGDDGRRHVCQ